MAQTYGQQQTQPPQPPEYTLPGVLHFLQSEWRRYERDRNEWEIERAEMKARIALLEGERRGIENMKTDLMRRVKMLEYALRQERSKYLASASNTLNTKSIVGESTTSEDGPTTFSLQAVGESGSILPVISGTGSTKNINIATTRDPKNRGKSRELLKACMQEIDYLTNAVTNGGLNEARSNIPPTPLEPTNLVRRNNKSNTVFVGTTPEISNLGDQRKLTDNTLIKRPSKPTTASSISPGDNLNLVLDQNVSQSENSTIITENVDNSLFIDSKVQDETKYPEEERSSPDSPNYEHRNNFVLLSSSSSLTKKNGVNQSSPTNGQGDEDYSKEESRVLLKPRSPEESKTKITQGRPVNKTGHRKSAEEIKEEEEQLTKDVQKKFNLSEGKVMKFMKNAKKRRSQEIMANNNGSDPQLDELSNVSFTVEEDENTQKVEADKFHQNGTEQKMWRPRFTLRSHLDTVRSLCWNQTELVVVSGSEDGTVKLWDLKTPISQKPTPIQDIEPSITYRGHVGAVSSVILASEQRRCYSASVDATIRVWNLPSPKREIYAPVDTSLNLNTYIGHSDAIWDIRLFPLRNLNTQLLASASADGTVKIWDTNIEGSALKTSWSYYGSNSGKLVNGEGRPPIPTSVDFVHTDLKRIAVSYRNSIIKMFDIETGQCVVEFKSDETYDHTPGTQINRIITHPTLPLIFSAHEDQYIRFFDINTGQPTFSMLAHLDSVTTLDVDPSGMILISGGHDSSVRLWDIFNTHTCIQEFGSHRRKSDEGVMCVQYHPTLPWLASGGADSIANLALVFFSIQLGRKFDVENPDVLLYVRLAYASAQLLILAIYYYVYLKINATNDMTTFEYIEPSKPFTSEPEKLVKTTFRDYDLEKLNELVKQTLIGVGIMAVLHIYFNFTQPLFIQTVLPVKNAILSNIIQIHLFRKKPEGELKRPFKNVSPFGAFTDSQPQTDKASIKKAKKAAKKDE
ncbi:hypothetical protein G9A89_000058 [Geosiphon pyriformis]|nr:hypothetical protein G9A89_000058 [Geosiphon pyriformis]